MLKYVYCMNQILVTVVRNIAAYEINVLPFQCLLLGVLYALTKAKNAV